MKTLLYPTYLQRIPKCDTRLKVSQLVQLWFNLSKHRIPYQSTQADIQIYGGFSKELGLDNACVSRKENTNIQMKVFSYAVE